MYIVWQRLAITKLYIVWQRLMHKNDICAAEIGDYKTVYCMAEIDA